MRAEHTLIQQETAVPVWWMMCLTDKMPPNCNEVSPKESSLLTPIYLPETNYEKENILLAMPSMGENHQHYFKAAFNQTTVYRKMKAVWNEDSKRS